MDKYQGIQIDLSQESQFNVLPLKDLVFFPHMVVPLIIGRKESMNAVEKSMEEEQLIFLVAQKEAAKDEVGAKDLYRFGVVARILQVVKLPNGLLKIVAEGIIRAKVLRYVHSKTTMQALVHIPFDDIKADDELEARKRYMMGLFKNYLKLNEEIPEEVLFSFNQWEDIEKVTDFVSAYLDVEIKLKQKLLSRWRIKERLADLISLLKKEVDVLSLKNELDEKVRSQMMKSQRHYFLQEQLRVIRDELGEEDENAGDVAFLMKKIKKASLPQAVLDKSMEEITRLQRIPPLSPEYNVIRTYLEWVLALPWSKRTTDEIDIDAAKKILDDDHYGLQKPKKRILEYIAVLQRKEKIRGAILCLTGPPGVGKTSLGKSIARALGRNFVRISLGGVHDEAEIRGHRRTYIGSLPGKIIQGIKKAGTVNPVFLLDEVDKLGNDYRGDPSSALLEVLDPEQNSTFIDHYMEVEYDLSRVMFIVTANNPNEIPEPLYDRMEIIELPGYIDFEKMQIARRHLIAKQLYHNGLNEDELSIDDAALREIIVNYTLEAGVRNLEREIGRICRQTVIELSQGGRKKKVKVTLKNIKKYLGEPKYPLLKLRSKGEIGVANGMAWTAYGGDLLRVEVNLLPGKDKLTLTGKLGEVMQESAMIALAYIRSKSRKFNLDKDFINKYEIHIHLPEGAVSKDGPSAGITLTTAVLSALKKQPFPDDVTMTGEITLRGKVLPVGGLNEKLLAAKRHGIKQVILPAENRSDIKELNKELLEDLELHFVRHYDQVHDLIFGKKKSAKNAD